MKILCGTDFSIHAINAANVAVALAARCNTTLRLVHALSPSGLEYLSQKQAGQLRSKLRRKLVAEGRRLRASGVRVRESFVLGMPHQALTRTAARFKSNVIVVSTLGQMAPRQLLVGSVAERTAQNSTVPTLVVRDHKRLIAWAEGKRPLRVLVGYDFSPSSDAALRWVASLKEIGPCNLTVTYLSWPPAEAWRLGIGLDPSDDASSLAIHKLLERDLKERCAAMLGETEAKLQVEFVWGSRESHLLDQAKAEEADLMVVGTNQRRGLKRFWLGSVSRGILHHAPTNVACVPMAEDAVESATDTSLFRRVLVATDFSKLGNKAVASAYGATRRGGEVSLLHVIPSSGAFKPKPEGGKERPTKRKREIVARLQALVPAGAHDRGIQSRVEVVEHYQPATAIAQAAERAGAELICLGSRGQSGLKRKLLGSVTESVMRRSKRPVLVIRD